MHSKTTVVDLKENLGNNREVALLAKPASHSGIAKKLQNFSGIEAPSDLLIPPLAKTPCRNAMPSLPILTHSAISPQWSGILIFIKLQAMVTVFKFLRVKL